MVSKKPAVRPRGPDQSSQLLIIKQAGTDVSGNSVMGTGNPGARVGESGNPGTVWKCAPSTGKSFP